MMSSTMFAATTLPTITKSYNKVPLSEVLKSIEKKTHYTIVYDKSEVDGTRLITTSFNETRVTSAVKRVLGKNYQVKVTNKIITVTYVPQVPKTEKTEESPVMRVDSIQAKEVISTTTHFDTLVRYQTRRVERPAMIQPEPRYAHCSHGLILGLGAGYGAVCKHGHGAGQADLSYAFFWSENWGFSLGIGADCYHSIDKNADARAYNNILGGYTDTDKEIKAELQTNGQQLDIRHTLVSVNMPLMLQMAYPLTSHPSPLTLYGSLGARIGYPIVHSVETQGEVENKGYYDKWNLTLENMHEFGTAAVQDKGTFPVQTLAIAPQAEIGVVIPLKDNKQSSIINHQSSISIGAYGNVSVWNEQGYLPWQVGVKLAYRYRKAAKTKPKPTVYETVTVTDTLWEVREVVDTIRTLRYDTILRPAAAIQKVMERSIIWFDLDKTDPKLDPVDMLDEIAAILVANPMQRIEVNGHTCDLGQKAYNESLSLRRAQRVQDMLLEKGVRPEQMEIHAYANSKPYYSKVHDRYLDRRVEIVPLGQ